MRWLDRLNRRYDALPEPERLGVAALLGLPGLMVAAGPIPLRLAALAWLGLLLGIRARHCRRGGLPRCRHLAPHARPCPRHADDPDPAACPDVLFVRTGSGGWGIPVRDGGSSYINIRFCPFCSERLGPDAAEN